MTHKPLKMNLLALFLLLMGYTTRAAQVNVHYYAQKEVGFIYAGATVVEFADHDELTKLLDRIRSDHDVVKISATYSQDDGDTLPHSLIVYYHEAPFDFDEFDLPLFL